VTDDSRPAITWGLLPDGCLDRVLLCSPHFDDAALGAAYLLFAHPGATVVTVCGGPPARYPDPPTEWDALGGFVAGDDVVALRREEDRAAMDVLGGATPVWLDFVDHQYLAPTERAAAEDIAKSIEAVIDEVQPTAVFVPMGLANPDHVLTHEAGALLAARRTDLTWFCYEDSGYKHIPGMLAWRISKLFASNLWPTPMVVPAVLDHDRKRRAIECYVSQLPPLNRDHSLGARIGGDVPEQHWLLAPPPRGWERMREM